MTHHPSFYYPAAHQEVTNELCYSIEERQGLALLLGEPGTGKTTLLRNLFRTFTSDFCAVFVSDVSVTDPSLLNQIASELRIPAAGDGAAAMLKHFLQETFQAGRTNVVLVDEAQLLTDRQLQEVHFLTNLELEGQKLVQLILAGQPSLAFRLTTEPMEALGQRVSVRASLEPLSLAHTNAYIRLRLETAGSSDSHLFTPDAVIKIHALSRGIPRMVNLICDRALLLAFAEDARRVDESMVLEVSHELRIDEQTGGPHPSNDSPTLEQRLSTIEGKLDWLIDVIRRGDLGRTKSSQPFLASGPPDETRGETVPEELPRGTDVNRLRDLSAKRPASGGEPTLLTKK
jgi:general secretion pathway protein A